MDVLIKNIKMPKEERKVVLILKSDGEVSVYEDKHGLVRFTDAVELSEHGDLIDRRELLKHRFEVYDSNEELCEDYVETYHILEAPVVLEAST